MNGTNTHTPEGGVTRRPDEETLLTDEEIRAAVGERQRDARAALAPLPGPLRDTLAGEPIGACGLTFRPLCFGDIETLVMLHSPLAERFVGSTGGTAEPKFGVLEIRDAAFLLTIPVEDAYNLAKAGQAQFRDSARQALMHVPVAEIPQLGQAIQNAIERARSTSVNYRATDADHEGNPAMGFTPTPDGPTTASGGTGTPSPK